MRYLRLSVALFALARMFGGTCAAALASDDFNNSRTRPRPVAMAVSP
jgi:hypothetical protein